jgi:competence protein ComGC
MEFLKELWQFLKVRKKFWLMPVIIVLLIFALLIIATAGTAIAPFIYTLF